MNATAAFGERLKAAREKAGLSIRDAAAKAKASPADWGRWEAGDSEPAFTPAVEIALLLGVDPLWLCSGQEAEGTLA